MESGPSSSTWRNRATKTIFNLMSITMEKEYLSFLESKKIMHDYQGFDPGPLSSKLFDFQADIVRWACRKGRAALFENCGLGKTFQSLQWADQVCKHTGGDVLIIAPLAVSRQTVVEGEKFGFSVNICKSSDNIKQGINITNYEKLHKFNPDVFCGVVADESGILKSFNGKIRNQMISMWANTPFRLVCTATPSPNDYEELGNQSEFLGICSRTEMLAMFFVNDTKDCGNWRLKGHAINAFWRWVCSWAVMVQSPGDLGYSNANFELPPIEYHDHVIRENGPSNGMLFTVEAKTLTERRIARKNSIEKRCKIAADLVNSSNESWLVWCGLNDESRLLADLINDCVEVKGSDSDEHKEKSLIDFADGKIHCLVSKVRIAGYGMNFQNCHNVIFVGLSDSFEDYYQAVRRVWRFGQKHKVNVHVITHESEGRVVANIKRKESQFIEMYNGMVKNMSDITKQEITNHTHYSDEYNPSMKQGKNWVLYNDDCVECIKKIDDNSIHYSIFSPPFSSLFTYSNSVRDIGNCRDDEEFIKHFKFLAHELFRVTMPGRLLSFHVMNLPATIGRDGFIGIKDLRGGLIRIFQSVGFIFHSEVCIWKDPLIQAVRTKSLTLAHKQISKDAARCAQGYADYVITMRKEGINPEPVSKGRGFEYYIGSDNEPKEKKTDNPRTNKYSHAVWRRYASPVWMDIDQTRTLNEKLAKEKDDERHLCPLQLDVIERCIELWTNPGDTVFSPFAGIGSEGYCALQMGRRFIGIELKKSYFDVACKNLADAKDRMNKQMRLFDEIKKNN